MDFKTRYRGLNERQKQAVDHIDGPVMVIAGPGTGKTELLSMRAANILQKTDVLAQNILCLTFTESGAAAMRARLGTIIGRDAYKVAIHTFHSFGSEIINNNREYFYRGAAFRAADELAQLEILTTIFDELDHGNLLASKMNGEYTYLSDTMRTISELKRSGLTSDELLKILDAGDAILDAVETDFAALFAERISKTTSAKLAPLAAKVANITPAVLPLGLTPLSTVLALSLAHAIDEATDTDSTKPLTSWKNSWFEKNQRGEFVFKSRKRHDKLRALSFVYFRYLTAMETAGLYDFDDMILQTIHAVETQPDLKFNLQETYQYIMVDEFQDTNLAQLRLLLNLTDNPVNEGEPNLLVVGDDDQAIYSFQGAEVGNIIQLASTIPTLTKICLIDNYRSAPVVLAAAREVIKQGSDRLEIHDPLLDKMLVPHVAATKSKLDLTAYTSQSDEYAALADLIAKRIAQGEDPASIVVLARKHRELEQLLPYLAHRDILANYERRDNILELDIITHLELLISVLIELHSGHLKHADALLPELLSHPAWGIAPEIIWNLSLASYRDRVSWAETMATLPELAPLHTWLITTAGQIDNTPLEAMLDQVIGHEPAETDEFVSPLKQYFFSEAKQAEDPTQYLVFLDALRTIRTHLRDYAQDTQPKLSLFLEYIDLHRRFNKPITTLRPASERLSGAIHLMTTHKSKGLEFDTVYIVGLADNTWGSRARSGFSKVAYPENMPLTPKTGSTDEQLRLLYVAMTRAKRELHLSFSGHDDSGKERLLSEFLLSETLPVVDSTAPQTLESAVATAELDWRAPLLELPKQSMRDLLIPQLERYKLSSTHVNNFVDVARGGPSYFLLQSLLHFPSHSSPASAFGTAIHEALQLAQNHRAATGNLKPLEDTIHDFETVLETQHLSEHDLKFYTQKGVDCLGTFLASPHTHLASGARAELDFAGQNVYVEDAHLTGKLDVALIDKDEKTIAVVDYKTGKASSSWHGKTDYEKIKLHKYKQQLMFYKLLIEHSRDYAGYRFTGGYVQFVEPDRSGEIVPPLQAEFSDEEYQTFTQLVKAIWQAITTLDLPDVGEFSDDYAGMVAFEQSIIDKYA